MSTSPDLRSILVDLGVDPDDVERAAHDGTLELLALEKVMAGDNRTLDLAEVAALSGLPLDDVRRYWRALGLPGPREGEKLFGNLDVELMSAVVSFIDDGSLEPALALQMARVVGSSMAKIANAQVEAAELRRNLDTADAVGAARRGLEMLAILPRVMELVWRRQLSIAARRRIMRAAAGDDDRGVLVGFADLVGFTARTQRLSEDELAQVVGRFEAVAFDTVGAHRGRVVKMIGDEVMFLHQDVRAGAELALDLAARFRDDPVLADVRVGLASGSVLERDGDVYGHVVNLANRLEMFAYPGSVVVSSDVAATLEPDPRFMLRPLGVHELKDIGEVEMWLLRAAGDTSERPYARVASSLRRRGGT